MYIRRRDYIFFSFFYPIELASRFLSHFLWICAGRPQRSTAPGLLAAAGEAVGRT